MNRPRLLIPVLTCLGLLAIPLGLVPSQVMNYLTGMLQAGNAVEFSLIWPVLLLFFLATVGVAGLDIVKTFLTGLVLEQKVQSRILRIFDRLLRTSPDFYRKNEPAKVSKRVTNETRQVEFFWLNLKLGLPITLIGLLGFGYVLFFGIDQNTALIGKYVPADYSQKGNWFLASLIIMLAPLQSAFLLFDKKIQTVNRRAMIVDDDLANISLETLDSVAEIRSHFAFDYALSRVKINLDRLRRVEIDITKLRSVFSGLGPVLDGLAKVFLLGMGARLCLGDLQIPVTGITVTGIEWKDYLGFAGMAMVVNGYVKNLGTSLLQWRMFKETIRRVEEYDNLPIDFFVAEEAPTIAGDKDKILFNKLSFETADGTRILNDL
ncbi:MAG: ABC transporter ATP-binding protein, partial [Desulfuromonadales bacterium]|nr:ABC transporter ATP-binding protein [Desulfuromonadales bacterium]